jgi:hypothetical protein
VPDWVGLITLNVTTATSASAASNAMTVRFNFSAAKQEIDGVTNSTSTNVTYKINKFRFANRDMLTLLASEFNKTFPDGAQLGLTTGFEFVVLDKAGHIFLNVSTNLSDSNYVFSITNNAGVSAAVGKISTVPNKTTETISSQTEPDFTIYYTDGKGNHFHFGGLITIRLNAVVEGGMTTFKSVSLTLSGSGGGTLFNPSDNTYDSVVLTGPWMATGVNIPQ